MTNELKMTALPLAPAMLAGKKWSQMAEELAHDKASFVRTIKYKCYRQEWHQEDVSGQSHRAIKEKVANYKRQSWIKTRSVELVTTHR